MTGEHTRLVDLVARLSTISEDDEPTLSWFVPALRRHLESEIAVAYRIDDVIDEIELRDYRSSGLPFSPADVSAQMQRMVRTGRCGLFDPRRPEPAQRNIVVDVGRYAAVLEQPDPPRGLGIGRPQVDQARARMAPLLEQLPLLRLCLVEKQLMRALVCEGETLLAWVGAFQPEPFSPRQRASLQSIVSDLQRRLALDQLIDETPVTAAALGTVLEALPAAAFVLGESGHIHHANAAGRRWASEHAADLKAAIAESMHGRPEAPLSLTRFAAPDRRPQFLAIARCPDALLARTAEAAKRWHLTPRQTQVLTLLAHGKANKTIAAELSCALHTVELHVAALLDKAQCDSRSALIAQLWAS